MCSVSTIIYVRHTRMWTFHWTLFKFILSQKKGKGVYKLLEEYICILFQALSVLVWLTVNILLIGYDTVQERGYYIHYEREVMLEDVATPRERLEIPTRSMPTGFQLPTRPSPSTIRWNWVQHAGVGLYACVLGCICWRRLAQNGGCGPTRWRWVIVRNTISIKPSASKTRSAGKTPTAAPDAAAT
jgi:hypothetical protein